MLEPNGPRLPKGILAASILLCWPLGADAADTKTRTRDIPRVWDEAALADWVTPVAGLNARPTISPNGNTIRCPNRSLAPIRSICRGSEPVGYWEMLQHIGPKPLITPETLKTEADWIGAGQLVFEEASAPQLICFDPRVISEFRSREFLEQQHVKPAAKGVIPGFFWVPTRKGVGLSRGGSCVGCHSLRRSDGLLIVGASSHSEVSVARPFQTAGIRSEYLESVNHLVRGAPPFFMGGGALGASLYEAWGVPWLKDDPNQRLMRVQERWPDAALYALALYIYSLRPPPNPNPYDEKAKAGERIFARQGCPACHTPPLYTNNKLTLAQGFTPPNNKPATLDVAPMSVGTDPGLALKTRKGTGYYKVPSLKGVWYRGHYLHDGSAASLEEMFDPARLEGTHVPGGWLPPGTTTRAIRGHEFGLKLDPLEKEQLIAFLRTL